MPEGKSTLSGVSAAETAFRLFSSENVTLSVVFRSVLNLGIVMPPPVEILAVVLWKIAAPLRS